MPNITLSACFSVAIASAPHWKTKLVVNHPDIFETTLTPILGLCEFWSHFSIITSRRPIYVVGHFTPTNILRLPPIIDLCIMDRSHSKVIPRKAFVALNRILQQSAYPANLPDPQLPTV